MAKKEKEKNVNIFSIISFIFIDYLDKIWKTTKKINK
jgi:hypothetical protein